jgi:hypothetical protein
VRKEFLLEDVWTASMLQLTTMKSSGGPDRNSKISSLNDLDEDFILLGRKNGKLQVYKSPLDL